MPIQIEHFHNNVYTRIFRVIGGLSGLLSLIHINGIISLSGPLYYIILYLSLFFFLYTSIVKGTELYYIFKYIFRGEFIHRNSPLKVSLTSSQLIVSCVKGICKVLPWIGTAAGFGLSIDEFTGNHMIRNYVRYNVFNKIDTGYSYSFPINPDIFYTDYNQVARHISKQIFIDIRHIDSIWIKGQEYAITSNEAQLHLCNLANRDKYAIREFREFISLQEKELELTKLYNETKWRELAFNTSKEQTIVKK
jgi:hypothetical protein